MEFQFNPFALFMLCLIGLIAFSVYRVRTMHRSGITRHLRGLLFAVKAIIRAMSKLVISFVGLLAASADTSEEEDSAEEGDLTGAYNFRTRKFDNGTDPYGWYEEDL